MDFLSRGPDSTRAIADPFMVFISRRPTKEVKLQNVTGKLTFTYCRGISHSVKFV